VAIDAVVGVGFGWLEFAWLEFAWLLFGWLLQAATNVTSIQIEQESRGLFFMMHSFSKE
jgi:hypothetical protein